MTATRDVSVVVAGAGIAGLTAALALSKAGFTVRLFERAERLEAVGAGLQLSPNALDVLDRLGLTDALSQFGLPARAVTLRSGRSGRVLARVPVASSDGRGYRALRRADLQTVLLSAASKQPTIELYLGHELTAIEDSDRSIRATFVAMGRDTPRNVETPLLVAADGVHSAAAQLLHLPPPAPSDMVAQRFAVETMEAAGDHDVEAWLGATRHAVSYPVSSSGARNLVLVTPNTDEGTTGFKTWDPALRTSLRRSHAVGTWPLLTVDPAPRMLARSRLVFVGDAAHATLPYAAQGAAMAIEDGWMLAACLTRFARLEEALAQFSAIRRPRITQVLKRVALHRLVYHLAFPLSLGRDAALAIRPPASLREELGWLYDWRAPDLYDRPAD